MLIPRRECKLDKRWGTPHHVQASALEAPYGSFSYIFYISIRIACSKLSTRSLECSDELRIDCAGSLA